MEQVDPAAGPRLALGGRLVLLIDDTPSDLALLVEYLKRTDLRVAVALGGKEGIRKAQGLRPDLILMDVRMPQLDGFATCRVLKGSPDTRDIPVIFLSGASELDDRLTGLRVGGVDYVTKPFSADEVIERVRVHLELVGRMRDGGASPDFLSAQAQAQSQPMNSRVVAAMRELSRDLANPPGLSELAERVGLSERRLGELFREATGTTAFAWLREQRFQLACHLLAQGALDIQEIASEVGYGSASNFTAMFRERLGVTPSDYRQAARQTGLPPAGDGQSPSADGHSQSAMDA